MSFIFFSKVSIWKYGGVKASGREKVWVIGKGVNERGRLKNSKVYSPKEIRERIGGRGWEKNWSMAKGECDESEWKEEEEYESSEVKCGKLKNREKRTSWGKVKWKKLQKRETELHKK